MAAGRRWLALAAGLLLPTMALAQSPVWTAATAGGSVQANGTSAIQATAVDAAGNVFVTGSFTGQVAFGGAVLISQGSSDIFVAKYLPATETWAWAQRGGGTSNDGGLGIAVSGSSVYITGNISNTRANASGVVFGPAAPQYGTSPTASADLVVAKYTDNGSSATLGWTQVAGGSGDDYGRGIAVSGSSVYVAGSIYNNRANGSGVLFGGAGTVAGTLAQYGAGPTATNDLLVAKYTDNGTSATVGWTQVAGGSGDDQGRAIVASGSSVYVTGYLTNTLANGNAVVLGGTGATAGTIAQYGASSTSNTTDLLVAKYTDNGPTATVAWSQVGGGTGNDQGTGIAVSSGRVYVAGTIANNRINSSTVLFGGGGSTAGTAPQYGASSTSSPDLVVAKYTDGGAAATLGWTQVAGGTGADSGQGIAVDGNNVYVTGTITNTLANGSAVVFGGTGAAAGAAPQAGATATLSLDLVVARYTDAGPAAVFSWSRAGGGNGNDYATGLAVSGADLYVAGYVEASRSIPFGSANGSPLLGTTAVRGVVGRVLDQVSSGEWQALGAVFNGGPNQTNGTAIDAAGNVFVTGSFTGQLALGPHVLSSAGATDLFVAKYVPATNTWAWAQSGGGTSGDGGIAVAVSGGRVYVTGYLTNTSTDSYGVLFGSTGTAVGLAPQYGTATAPFTADLVVAKYTDNGTSATLGWTQVAGGANDDNGRAIAVRGSTLYVAGYITNNTANTQGVVFGGTGTTAGTVAQAGASATVSNDMVVAKYFDQGNHAALGWTQVAGGSSTDMALGIALNGTNVYVTGAISNNVANAYGVLFGGTGTTAGTVAQYGASPAPGSDLVVAKYTDDGPTATVAWTQVAGGTSADVGQDIAVSGSSVYVAGGSFNSRANATAVVFGGTGTTAGTVPQYGTSASTTQDFLVAKYTDLGSTGTFNWSQVGGGSGDEAAYAIAANGNSVYVTGNINNNGANSRGVVFGGAGTTAGTVPQPGTSPVVSDDVLVARYLDNGPNATLGWTQTGGGQGSDYGQAIATDGSALYVAGLQTSVSTYGNTVINSPAGAFSNFLGSIGATALPVRQPGSSAAAGLQVFPNPATGAATLIGALPGTLVRVFDALGRQVTSASADATGTATLKLPAGLAAGVYVVRAGATALRLAVE